MADQEQEVSAEQANEALQQFMNNPESEPLEQPEPEPVEAASPEAEETEAVEEPVEEEAESDDVDSLKRRLTDYESESAERERKYESRLRALQQRTAQNEKILRERYLRKAAAADHARKVLLASRSEAGASESDVDRAIRELEGTMNERSTNYAPPPAQEMPVGFDPEEQSLVVNRFLSEKLMTEDEAERFSRWISTDATKEMPPSEQAVAQQSLNGFLHLAHARWQNGTAERERKTRTDDAVGAVRSVQRTQRAAAKAASSTTKAPRKTSAPKRDSIDVSKFTREDISNLLRQSVTENY